MDNGSGLYDKKIVQIQEDSFLLKNHQGCQFQDRFPHLSLIMNMHRLNIRVDYQYVQLHQKRLLHRHIFRACEEIPGLQIVLGVLDAQLEHRPKVKGSLAKKHRRHVTAADEEVRAP